MAFTTLTMQNPQTGKFKNAPIGFSWTSLFFGGFVPLLRGHYIAGTVWMLLMIFTGGLSLLFQMCIYNKQYLKYLLRKGYKVKYSAMPLDVVSGRVNIELPSMEKS